MKMADYAVCKRQQHVGRHYTFRFSCLRGVSRERLRLEFKGNIEVFGWQQNITTESIVI